MTSPHAKEAPRTGITVPAVFSTEGVDPFDEVEWVRRKAETKDEAGKVVWEQDGCEVPKKWSQLATNVVVSKYFYGDPKKARPDGQSEREQSVKQLLIRVCDPIAARGAKDDYFATPADTVQFRKEIVALCLNQYAAFNSPVWFNMGLWHSYGIAGAANNWVWDPEAVAHEHYPADEGPPVQQLGKAARCRNAYEHPQGSACFIQSVEDDMEGIMALATSEAMLFKYGSGTGSDLSTLRSSRERVAGGGRASGPVSFMRVYDAIASVVKSGGKTRRAAKMQTLKCWHPDVLEFIECKAKEEKKAQALIRAGYEANFNGEAYSSVMFQNCNMSVRCTDKFLYQASGIRPAPGPADRDWQTHRVVDGSPEGMPAYNACQLLDKVAEGTWTCGDPGMQYEDTIQRWHTCPNTAPINSSNPCAEYMFIDDSACNLASLNLLRFRREDGTIDVPRLRAAAHVFITAQEILVDMGSYPTAKIAENSHKFRPLGLGYCNLGSLLMACGVPYDSRRGRALGAALTAILSGQAYITSAEHARNLGPFEGFAANREPMLRVIRMHREAVDAIDDCGDSELLQLKLEAMAAWDEAIALGEKYGYRNSQVTLMAPTGTIAFMMDSDTTGIEPAVALITYKNLAGGGQMKIVNQTVPLALRTLGYSGIEITDILAHVEANDTIEGCPLLKDEHLPVFDCAFRPARGQRALHWRAHTGMLGAIQPFVSGAISKTVNMPEDATVEEIREAYLEGWRQGLKALAIYRNGSKWSQPVATTASGGDMTAARVEEMAAEAEAIVTASESEMVELRARLVDLEERLAGRAAPFRRRLPDTRRSLTHKFDIEGAEGYFTVGFFKDGTPGELFITMAKEGSTVGGLMDVIGTLTSLGLQYGVPLEVFVKKFAHSRFEPAGFTQNRDIPIAKSVIDYIFRWLGMEFIPGYRADNAPHRDEPPADHVRGVRADMVPLSVLDPEPSDSIDLATYAQVMNGFNGQPGNGAVALLSTPRTTPNTIEQAWRRSAVLTAELTGPACPNCQTIMVPSGPCYRCLSCGHDVGGCG